MAWLLLIIAGLLEVVWALALKDAHGFSRVVPSIVAVAAALASFVLLATALRALPVGTAYVAWVGIGATGVTLAGILLLGEAASPIRLVCAAMIVVGVIGLNLTTQEV